MDTAHKRQCRYNWGCLGARWAKTTTVPLQKIFTCSDCLSELALLSAALGLLCAPNAAANLDKHTCELPHMLPPTMPLALHCHLPTFTDCSLPPATPQPSDPTVGPNMPSQWKKNPERTSLLLPPTRRCQHTEPITTPIPTNRSISLGMTPRQNRANPS